MSQITPQLVKELREKTGAGMGDCKQALVDSNSDLNTAVEILRKKGAASADKRADRAAKEGIIAARTNNDSNLAVLVEINCETDFVARNAEFERYVNTVVEAYMANNVSSLDELFELKVGSDSIIGLHNEILAKFSEKIEIRRFDKIISNGYIADYIHAGSKLAVLIEVSESNLNDKSKSLIRNIAMQIAAMNPQFVDRSQVTQDTISKEIEIYKEVAIKEGKNPDIAERIATGKLEKYYQDSCLIEQVFVKDSSKTVKDVVAEISKESGMEVKILQFRRYYLGEV